MTSREYRGSLREREGNGEHFRSRVLGRSDSRDSSGSLIPRNNVGVRSDGRKMQIVVVKRRAFQHLVSRLGSLFSSIAYHRRANREEMTEGESRFDALSIARSSIEGDEPAKRCFSRESKRFTRE